MADCFPPEADDLHRRWLPREIFADIGIVDTEPVSDAPSEAAGVEGLAAQLAGILGGGGKVCPLRPPPPPPPPSVAAPRHGAQVCGLEGSAAAACSGINGVGGAAALAWPFVPYPPAQWQGGSNLANLGGVLDYYYSAFPPAPPFPVPPPANLRGGTGVFIPRTAFALPPAKGGIATRAWPGTATGTGTGRLATGRKQEWQQNETATTQQQLVKAQEEKCPRPELTLPQDWSYR
ncbi:large proline-rich protein BAG6-like [Panicum miliaceum]|uniref:Large proline-rich protein BAG6-like n=1 Tax=Panicum miliaceum TaxID=4540 RepID=A0A3L6ST78_PANMI|nr:large proline-rich protein BAG6-like [Panicum miliaceum]